MTKIRSLNPYAPDATYARAAEARDPKRFLFVSGQVPEGEDGQVPDAFKDQCRLAWRNVERQLATAGMTVSDLVKFTVFLSDRRYQAEEYEVRKEVLAGKAQPAMTIIVTGIYDPKWLLEIEATAVA